MKIGLKNNDLFLMVDNKIIQQCNIPSKVEKLKNLIYVTATSRENNDTEEFYYESAIVFQNFNLEKFYSCINNNIIKVDLRMHKENDKAVRDHGTGIRIKPELLEKLYDKKQIIKVK